MPYVHKMKLPQDMKEYAIENCDEVEEKLNVFTEYLFGKTPLLGIPENWVMPECTGDDTIDVIAEYIDNFKDLYDDKDESFVIDLDYIDAYINWTTGKIKPQKIK